MDLSSIPVDDRLRWFVGSLNRVVATAGETGGAFGLMEQWAPAGFSPPRHVHHREDAALFVIEGELAVQRGDEELRLGPGGFAFLPRDLAHTFAVVSEGGARFLELITPGGMEQFHVDVSDPAPAAALPPAGPPDVGRLMAALEPYGAEICGPPMVVPA